MADLEAAPVAGTRLGRYLFLREIASGAIGPLYELRSDEGASALSGLGRVINLSTDLDPDAEEAIVASAWDSLELRHENALCVADVVFGKGWVTLVHDYAEGSLLHALQARARERNSTFPLAVALRIAADIIEGLEQRRKVCETAGIAWTPGGTNASSLYLCGDGRTRSLDGQLVFTLLRADRAHAGIREVIFSAPETVAADTPVDERTGVFAVAAVLWQLLTGRELSSIAASASLAQTRTPVPRLNQAMPTHSAKLPAGLAAAVESALEFEPKKRPESLAAFRNALSRNVEIASYAQVIDYTDALLHRESTLFRLTLDPEPKLSDELRKRMTAPAHHDWTLDLAKKARLAADVPRPTAAASPNRTAASTARMKAPTLTFPSTRMQPATQPKKVAAPQHDAATLRGSGKQPYRTLIGISPIVIGGHPATSVAAAASAAVDLQPATVAEAISAVQPVAVPELLIETNVQLVGDGTSSRRSSGAPHVADVQGDAPSSRVMSQPAGANLTAEGPAQALRTAVMDPQPARHPICATGQGPVNHTSIRRAGVVQLTPMAVVGWSLIMIGVTAFATVLFQRLFTAAPANSPPNVTSTVASQSLPPPSAPIESAKLPTRAEAAPQPQPLATGSAEALPGTEPPIDTETDYELGRTSRACLPFVLGLMLWCLSMSWLIWGEA